MDNTITTTTGNATLGYLSVEKEDFALHSIKGVEIFSTGMWNGTKITSEDLDNIINAYEDIGFRLRPFLKLGHTENQKLIQNDGLPAAGWVGSLKKIGNKLIADFIDIPQKIYELIENKAYKKVSCEIYHNVEIEGKKYPRLLGAVALLGANMPAVMNLNDILAMYTNMGLKAYINECKLNIYDHKQSEDLTMEENKVIEEIVKEEVVEDNSQIEKLEFELNAEKEAKEKLNKDLEEKDSILKGLEEFKLEAEKKLEESIKKEKAADIDLYAAELVQSKLCSNAMKPLVKALFEDTEIYKINEENKEEKTLTKKELIKELLSLSKELAKINFEEKTEEGKPQNSEEDLRKQIEQYQKKNNCIYADAYKAVMKK